MIIKQDKDCPLTILWEKYLTDRFEKITDLCVSRFTDKEELLQQIDIALKNLELVKKSVAEIKQ